VTWGASKSWDLGQFFTGTDVAASPSFTADEILAQLDGCAKEMSFPMLDNGYVYLVDTRLSAYRDPRRWAMVIETVGFNFRARVPHGMELALYIFGNCLKRPPGTANEDFLSFVQDDRGGTLFNVDDVSIRPEAETLRIRETTVPIPRDPALLRQKGIALNRPPVLQPQELMRALVPEYRALFLATDDELYQRIPRDLPLFLRLNEWRHPDIAGEELPSQTPTFRMLAQALFTGVTEVYRPVQPPNNHWSNWPMSGTL
jgi:hypothetical protein